MQVQFAVRVFTAVAEERLLGIGPPAETPGFSGQRQWDEKCWHTQLVRFPCWCPLTCELLAAIHDAENAAVVAVDVQGGRQSVQLSECTKKKRQQITPRGNALLRAQKALHPRRFLLPQATLFALNLLGDRPPKYLSRRAVGRWRALCMGSYFLALQVRTAASASGVPSKANVP